MRRRGLQDGQGANIALSMFLIVSVSLIPLAGHAAPSQNGLEKNSSSDRIRTERVSCIGGNSRQSRTGTVTVLENKARITAYHVVKNCETIYIGNRYFKVSYADPVNDIAVLGKVKNFQQLNCQSIAEGEALTVTGFPMGAKQVLTSPGRGQQFSGDIFGTMHGLVVDGMSGGPVLNVSGDLVGLAKSRTGLSKLHFITGPNLCASLENYEGAILNVSS